MSQTTSPSDKPDKRVLSPLVPPEERFWQRYSPHSELPLSGTGSLVLHILAFGLLGLAAWLATTLFSHANRSLPVEAVRVSGGGGNPHGRGDGPNAGAPVEVGAKPNDAQPENAPPEDVSPPEIKIDPGMKLDSPKFEDPTARPIQQGDAANNPFRKLRERAGKIQSPGSNPPASGPGQGGTGEGGGSGGGKGRGIGNENGEGPPANLTQREKRMLRWTLLFNTMDSSDYVAQLAGLGATLAIPVRENGDDFDYMFVRNLLARPAKLIDKDAQEVQRLTRGIHWQDTNPKNAAGVLSVLGLPMPNIKPEKLHFLAFMPEALEKKLLQLELDYLHRKYPKRSEDDIFSTTFRIRFRGGKYVPEVEKQKLKQ